MLQSYLTSGHEFTKEEVTLKYKVALLNSAFAFAGVSAFILGFLRLAAHAYILAGIDFAFSALVLVLVWQLRHHKERIELIASIAIGTSLIIFIAIYFIADNAARLIMFFPLLGAAFFLKGRGGATFTLIGVVVAVIVGYHFFDNGYSHFDVVFICLIMIGSYFLYDTYQSMHDDHESLLLDLNRSLELKVQDRTHELEIANEKLTKLSHTDPLTELWNRRYFMEQSRQYIDNHLNYCFALIDVDNFKEINDEDGHLVGDQVLQWLAQIITKKTSHSEKVFRIGGDEFAIIFLTSNIHDAEKLCEDIAREVASDVGVCTLSIGLTQFHDDQNIEDILHRADQAMYKAKDQGRDQIVIG